MLTDEEKKRALCRACGDTLVGAEVVATYSHHVGLSGRFYKCKTCQTESVVDKIDYDKLYENRESTNYPASNGILVFLKKLALRQSVHKLLSDYPHSSRVLDFGCGGGEFANAIRSSGFERVVASDVQNDRPGTLSLDVDYVSVETLGAADNFDVIVMRHVIEHLEYPHVVMEMLRNKLSENGRLIVEFPSQKSVWKKILLGYWPGYFFPFHTMVLSQSGAKQVFEKSGLSILNVESVECPIMGTLFVSIGIPRSIARLLSVFAYPVQYLLSKLFGGSEAMVFVVKRDDAR